MHSVIEEKLKALAISENIHFLWVVESGSRAWGFASPDSDYDVRGIYIRPPDEYLKIEKQKDTFEWIENHWFDIGAWDLQKSLRLLRNSNATLLEWTHSPIVYLQDTTFIDEWRMLLSDVIQAAPLLHHYRGIAKHSLYGLTLEEPIRLKKWFYVIRALLAAHWIITQGKLVSMTFAELLSAYPQAPMAEIEALLQIKANEKEDYHHLLSPHLRVWTERLVQLVSQYSVTKREPIDFEILNQFFLKTIHRVYANH